MPRTNIKRWDADQVQHIRSLAGEGLAGRQIAEQYRTTRNAIMGVCHRNGIVLGGASPITEKCKIAAGTSTIAEKRKQSRQRVSAPIKAPPSPEPPQGPTGGILIHQLTNSACRWPVHDKLPGWYCGAHAEGSSYCAHHHARAYRGFE